jgi:hypothetical protein
VLAAFSLIEDYTLYLTQEVLDKLVQDIAERERQPKDDVLKEARRRADAGTNRDGRSLQKEIADGIDVLALVIVLMNRAGLKPVISDEHLQSWLIDYFVNDSTRSKTVGGAAANEAYILQEIGLPVIVHTPYHHPQQADCAPEHAHRLVFGASGPYHIPLCEGRSEDARRHSLILQLTPIPDAKDKMGPVLRVDSEEIRPKVPDRVILRVPNPHSDAPWPWKTLRVIWKANDAQVHSTELTASDPTTVRWEADASNWVAEILRDAVTATPSNPGLETEKVFKDFKDGDLPFLPVFQHPSCVTADGVLTIELATSKDVASVATNAEIVLLGGLQALGQTLFTNSLTDFLRVVLVNQLKTLSEHGASMHFELSGISSSRVLDQLRDIFLDARIKNVSINREELVQITSEHDSRYFAWPKPNAPESPFGVFMRARHFLQEFAVDTCYIHDQEMDILVARNDPGISLKQHRQAMLLAKAAVPEGLLRRSEKAQKWPLTLSAPSLCALLAFAREYAEFMAAHAKVSRRAVEDEILKRGYYRPTDPHEVAVVVAPGIYVEFGEGINMTGAGDMCFAVHAAFS